MEIKLDEGEFPHVDPSDGHQVVKIKGEGKITGRKDGAIVVEFPDIEVVGGNFADRSLRELTRKSDVPDNEPESDDEF